MEHKPQSYEPFIPANETLPEISGKAIFLSVILVIVLAAANAYLGLKIGITISASIPAAVISMGVLRLFRHSNILENNIVQTAASAGESTVGGIAFILPALIIIHFWQGFHFWETMWIALIGGILGVLYSIPVRRILLFHRHLRFPEGTAIGHVLIAGSDKKNKAGLKYLISGGLVGALISFAQAGLQILSTSLQFWQRVGGGGLFGFVLGFDPALLAAGYIVGASVATSAFVGVIIGWLAGVPILSLIYHPTGDAADAAMTLWRNQIRYIGVGTMLTGGFWTLITLIKPILEGIQSSFASLKTIRTHGYAHIPRTERDIPMNWVLWGVAILCVPLIFLICYYLNNPILNLTFTLKVITVIAILAFIIFIGFIFTVLGAYFAGLVGSTNSPLSALTMATLILMSLLIIGLFTTQIQFSSQPVQTLASVALAIIISTVLSAAGISNETIQDLKAGHMVGATPWKQQVMLIIGVVISSFLVPFILQLLYQAYGIGGVFPRPGMDPSHMLAAPQAGMMAALAQGAFSANLPWEMLGVGALIALICIIINYFTAKKGFHLEILAVGFGIYLPLDATMPFVFGGIASYFTHRALRKMYPRESADVASNNIQRANQRGLTLACGIVAGAALMGVILAIPFALMQSTDILKVVSDNFSNWANLLSMLMTVALFIWIYKVVCPSRTTKF